MTPEDPSEIALDCYRAAVRNVAFYAIELDQETTAAYRRALAQVEQDSERVVSFSALMRDYHGKARAYVNRLCGELASTAASLSTILDNLADGEGDCDGRLRAVLARLRGIAGRPDAAAIRAPLLRAAAAIQEGLDEIARRYESSVAHLMDEIRALHKKIDSLESAASLDILSTLLGRADMEKRVEAAGPNAHILLFTISGLRLAQSRFAPQVAAQLSAAFLKRLNRILPEESVAGRWGEEEIMVLVPAGADLPPQRTMEEQLSGSYACVHEAKNVRPTVQVRVTTRSVLQPA